MDYKQLENLVRECQQKENELFWEQEKTVRHHRNLWIACKKNLIEPPVKIRHKLFFKIYRCPQCNRELEVGKSLRRTQFDLDCKLLFCKGCNYEYAFE
jgi:hypothetical protein